MRPLGILKAIAKGFLKGAGNALLPGAGDIAFGVGEEVWNEWNKEKAEAGRHAEIQAVVQMAAQEFRQQVASIVREVAAQQPSAVQQRLAQQLEQLPNVLRRSLRRPADMTGQSVPPDLPLQNAQDLVSLLTGHRPAPEAPPIRVTLIMINGPQPNQPFVFEERTTCLLGRDKDCQPRLDKEQRSVSRHHCLLDINPPDVCVRDLGSLGGTFVNGELIGQRPKGMSRDDGRTLTFAERPLKDGDELKLCKNRAVIFRVNASVPPQPKVLRCSRCGQDVTGESPRRDGDFVCAACRQRPEQIVRDADGQPAELQGYIILKELGRGGMGAVFLARHARTGKQVALKLMLPQVAADDRAVKRFLREMTTTRLLNHRHVVRLEDVAFVKGSFFMVLEYCDAGSVAELMKQRGGTLPVDEAVEITLQALEGLHYAHGLGLVHRDLKPANLFLSGSGSARVVKVGDYGLAKAFDDAGLSGNTRTGETAGTPAFIARAQVIDFKCSKPEVDVWAMAASLYNMLTGWVPRDFATDRDPWLTVLETDPIPIRQRKASLPPRLAEVIDEALKETPGLRFTTAAALRDALEDAC